MVGARGFELPARLFIRFRRCSPEPRKQRPSLNLPPCPNAAGSPQTPANVDKLLHTHYARKAFLRVSPTQNRGACG